MRKGRKELEAGKGRQAGIKIVRRDCEGRDRETRREKKRMEGELIDRQGGM